MFLSNASFRKHNANSERYDRYPAEKVTLNVFGWSKQSESTYFFPLYSKLWDWIYMAVSTLKFKQLFRIVNKNNETPKDETETELSESKTIIEEKVRC